MRAFVSTIETQQLIAAWGQAWFHSVYGPKVGEYLWRRQPARAVMAMWLAIPKAEA